jgi:hypothetical protein
MSQHPFCTETRQRFESFQRQHKRIGNLDFDTASHCVYHLAAHVIFCTKFRRRALTPERLDFLDGILRDIALRPPCSVVEF